jgi:predicted phage terminase large subunit-like protein
MAELLFAPPVTRQRILSSAIAAATASVASKKQLDVQVTPHYGEWLQQARPEYRWDARHFHAMQGVLDRVTAGEKKRVIFQIPIRHGKTEHSTVGYLAYRLERLQKTRLLVGSYNDRQAQKLSREIRKLSRARGVVISPDKDTASEWETVLGGGVRAVGAGAGVASVNADGIAIDDPFGSREEAESAAHRDRVFDWLTNDILARCEPHTWVLLSMSRWHQDDVVGRIRAQLGDSWLVLDLPGEAEEEDPLGRAIGDPLWPELRGREWLDEKRRELGPYGFASLIQGRPRPRGGGMFKWDDWKLVDVVPMLPRILRYWDTAGTEATGSNDPDFTVGTAGGRLPDLRTLVVDQVAFRHSVTRRDQEIAAVAKSDVEKYRGRIVWWFETEAGIGGKDRTANLKRIAQSFGIPVYDEPATGNKVLRAEPLASAVGAGNVLLGPGAWRDELRREAADFPAGKHDDRTDSASGMYNKLSAPVAQVGFTSVSM